MTAWSLSGFTELAALGEGGFGRVVLARHDVSGQLVAIKYLFARFAADPELRAQFRHEAAILRLVVSPYVARLFEFVETDAGAAIVMEAVPGMPLRDILAREPVLAPESALAILKGSLLGLAAAHTAGAVHRDYKPGNVLVRPDNQSRLVDFGIAVLSGHSGLSSGTPAYMAPEQWQGGPATPATDVYAATCVFFQCVTGHRPYESADTDRLRSLHLHAPTPVEGVPDAVLPLVVRGMSKDPATRPASAAVFVHELETAAHAGYGPDWERRGWQRLATHAGALLSLSPLAFLSSTVAGALAPGAVTAASGGAAGGILGTMGAKIAAIVLGVGVVAGATAVVVTTTGGDDPPVAVAPTTTTSAQPAALRVDVADRSETHDTFTFQGQYAKVSGLGDAAVEQRINARLTAPLDEWIDVMTTSTSGAPAGTPPAEATVEATVRIAGPKVLSVEYLQVAGDSSGYYFGAGGAAAVAAVTINLSTGDEIGPMDVFPNAGTPDGAAEIAARIRAANPQGLCGDQQIGGTQPLELPPFTNEESPVAAVVFTPDGVEFRLHPQRFGYPEVCDLRASPVPYESLTDLMTPEAVAMLTG